MNESILNSIKKLLGIHNDDKAFDTDIIIHINTVLNTLTQLGIGPEEGFTIADDKAIWTDFINNSKKYDMIKTYIYLRVRLLFDPPLNSSVLESIKQTITEYEWRINIQYENDKEVLE